MKGGRWGERREGGREGEKGAGINKNAPPHPCHCWTLSNPSATLKWNFQAPGRDISDQAVNDSISPST